MSLVGPVPEIPEMLPFSNRTSTAFAVKPGLTGLAQVSGRNILRFAETNLPRRRLRHTPLDSA